MSVSSLYGSWLKAGNIELDKLYESSSQAHAVYMRGQPFKEYTKFEIFPNDLAKAYEQLLTQLYSWKEKGKRSSTYTKKRENALQKIVEELDYSHPLTEKAVIAGLKQVSLKDHWQDCLFICEGVAIKTSKYQKPKSYAPTEW